MLWGLPRAAVTRSTVSSASSVQLHPPVHLHWSLSLLTFPHEKDGPVTTAPRLTHIMWLTVPPHWSPTSRSAPCNWLIRPPPFDSALSGNRFSPRSTTDLSRYRPIRIFVFKFNALKACNKKMCSLKKRRNIWVSVFLIIWNFNLFEWQHVRTTKL